MVGNSKVSEAADTLRTALADAAPVVDNAAERFQVGANRHAEAVQNLADEIGLLARRTDEAIDSLIQIVTGICISVIVYTVCTAIAERIRGDE